MESTRWVRSSLPSLMGINSVSSPLTGGHGATIVERASFPSAVSPGQRQRELYLAKENSLLGLWSVSHARNGVKGNAEGVCLLLGWVLGTGDPPTLSALQVTQTFRITLRPVDDALPQVQNFGMRVQEGVRKTITEFELKAVDADTEVGVLPWPLV